MLIHGKGENEEMAQKDHDKNLEGFLKRCKDLGVKLNKGKMKLCRKEVKFLGHVISDEGLKADPDKIEAVKKMSSPQSVEEVQRFAGFVNYLAKFLPKLSDAMVPLRRLTHQETEWSWTEEHESAFQLVKQLVTEALVLAYYRVDKQLTLQTDASLTGLGAVLIQEDRPIAYASKLLTPTETRYAQIEKEMLSVIFGLEKFHTYNYGRAVKVENDHKPIEARTKKPLHKAPKRLQAMMMRLQNYDATVTYRKGTEVLLADTLSRASLPAGSREEDQPWSVNMASYLPITNQRLAKIRSETEKDETLQRLKSVILKGWPEDKAHIPTELGTYFHYKDELAVQDGLLFAHESE